MRKKFRLNELYLMSVATAFLLLSVAAPASTRPNDSNARARSLLLPHPALALDRRSAHEFAARDDPRARFASYNEWVPRNLAAMGF